MPKPSLFSIAHYTTERSHQQRTPGPRAVVRFRTRGGPNQGFLSQAILPPYSGPDAIVLQTKFSVWSPSFHLINTRAGISRRRDSHVGGIATTFGRLRSRRQFFARLSYGGAW